MSAQRQFEVGDEVYVVGRWGIVRSQVERITKTQAITKSGSRYRLRDGRETGGGSWDSPRIAHPNPHLDTQWRKQQLQSAANRLVRALESGTPQDIHAAFAVWDKLEKEVNGNV